MMREYRSIDFATIGTRSSELREYLSGCGITLHPSSALATMLRLSDETIGHFKAGSVPVGFDAEAGLEAQANVFVLSGLILDARGTEYERNMRPRLVTLAGGDPGLVAGRTRSQERDTAFELVCAAVCSRFATDVAHLDPDVVCEFSNVRWGLACKVAYGQDRRIVQAIRKGWNQLLRSHVDNGFVLVHMANKYMHDRLFRRLDESDRIRTLVNVDDMALLADAVMEQACKPIEAKLDASLRRDPIDDWHRMIGVIFTTHSFPHFRDTRTLLATTRLQLMIRPSKWRGSEGEKFARSFNEWWQNAGWPGHKSGHADGQEA